MVEAQGVKGYRQPRGRRLSLAKPGEAVGWLVHPALADSMLHLTAVAPKPPEGGWPWMSDDEKNGVVPGVTD